MKVQIQDLKEVFEIEVDPSGTVRSIKEEIAKLRNCKIPQVRLVYNGKVLYTKDPISEIKYDPAKRIDLDIDESYVPRKKPTVVDEAVLDQQFLTAISQPAVASKLKDERIKDTIYNLISAVEGLSAAAPGYEAVINRLYMAVEYEPEPDYRELYKDQLAELSDMQLAGEEDNLKALIATRGNVDEAVDWLIENGVVQ